MADETKPAAPETAQTVSPDPVLLPKVATGVVGLDDVLRGGVPAGRTTLLSGGPGSGKSLLALQCLWHWLEAGEACLLVTFEERADAVRQNALTLGWDLAHHEAAGRLMVFEARLKPEVVLSGDFSLTGLLTILGAQAATLGVRHIVIDAVDALTRALPDPVRERDELLGLHEWLLDLGLTALLTSKPDGKGEQGLGFLDFLVDCVLHLEQRVAGQITTRLLRVVKYRGSGFGGNEYPFVITPRGVTLVPLSSSRLRHLPLGAPLGTGQPLLDEILGGGVRKNSSLLISGTPGTGKTTLVATFAREACRRGERVLYLSFEESQEALLTTLLSPGIDLRPAAAAGDLEFLCLMPEAAGAEEHLLGILETLERFRPDHLLLDSVSACARLGEGRTAFDFVVRLVNACKERGITALLTNQLERLEQTDQVSGLGVSSLIDAVLLLRYVEQGGEVNRTLLVFKARGARHSNQSREYWITDRGIEIAELYVGEGGVLTGAARQEQEAAEDARGRRLAQEVETKRSQLEHLRATLAAQVATAEDELEALELESELRQEGREARSRLRGNLPAEPTARRGRRKEGEP